MREKIAAPGPQRYARCIPTSKAPVTIELDLICPRLALRQLLHGTGVHRLDKLEPLSENSFASGRVRKATRSIRRFIADRTTLVNVRDLTSTTNPSRLGSIRAKPGARVQCGQVLGLVGDSGNSAAPHLLSRRRSISCPSGVTTPFLPTTRRALSRSRGGRTA